MPDDEPQWISLELSEIEQMKRAICGNKFYWSRISFLLVLQLFQFRESRGPYFEVLDEIDALEGIGPRMSTKSADQFRRKPLHPLFHKHFFTARYVPQNIFSRWGVHNGGNQDLNEVINQVAEEFGDDPDAWPDALAYKYVMEAFWDRLSAKRLTGEWIIFARHEGENYYLGVSTHAKGGKESEQLKERLRGSCEWEYPFAFVE